MDPILSLSRERALNRSFVQRSQEHQKSAIARLTEAVTTGKRINRPSDDASGYGQAARMDVLINRYEQYDRTITTANAWVDATQNNLDDLAELFTEIGERGIRAQNAIWNQDDRDIIADRIEAIARNVKDYLNTQENGEYLFAGSRTSEPPFVEIDGVLTYQGNTAPRTRPIGPGVEAAINLDGERLHTTPGGFTITQAIDDLIEGIRAGDSDAITTGLDRVNQSRDHVLGLGGEMGSLANRLDDAQQQLLDAEYIASDWRSQVRDADLAESMTSLQRAQTSLQATLQVTASLQQMSLLNYI